MNQAPAKAGTSGRSAPLMLAIFSAIRDGARNGFSEPRDRAASHSPARCSCRVVAPIRDARFVGLIPPVFKRSAGWRQERVCGAQRLQVQIRGYRGLARQQRPHARDLNPRKRPQNAPHLSETRKGWFVSEYVVGLEGLEPPSKPLLRTSPAVRKAYFSRARKETLPLTR